MKTHYHTIKSFCKIIIELCFRLRQALCPMETPKIIGLCGHKHSGKSYVAARIAASLTKKGYTVQRLSFADKVREYESALWSFKIGRILDDMRDNLEIPEEVCRRIGMRLLLLRLDPRSWFKERATKKRRFLLQRLGTEVFRNHVSNYYWINALLQSINKSIDFVVVDDTRFVNEASICNMMVRVFGPASVEEAADAHSSENPDSIPHAFEINNSSREETPNVDQVVKHAISL